MSTDDNQAWKDWAAQLRKWGLEAFTAWLLEAAGPVSLVGAQLVYMGQPMLETFTPAQRITAFARLLEEPENRQAFTQMLREEQST